MSKTIDLNADMGEYANETEARNEARLMPLVTSCSIACGGHAGDATSIRRTAKLARLHKVCVGAHLSYPDREGFGRRSLEIDHNDLRVSLHEQMDLIRKVLTDENISLAHMKPHGALYNDAAKDSALAALIVAAAGDAIIVGPPRSEVQRAANRAGARFLPEGFVDRRYRKDGSLTARSEDGAVIADIADRAEQARRIAMGENIDAADGRLTVGARTLCIHSDSPGAVETASAVRDLLQKNGVCLKSFSSATP